MEDLANELSQRVQIGLDQARTVINQVSNTILRKADPNKASELLSKLPSSITTVFTLDDKAKSQKATEEAVKLLQEKTHEPGVLDSIMGKFKKVDLNPFD
jgi:hypothetical protein